MSESEHLKRYRVERRLFEGVFTTLDLVTDLCIGELRVLKTSDLDRYPCANSQQLFNELVFHGLMVSPFVIRKHFSFQVGHLLYVVLEYAENGDLFAYGWIDKKPMPDEFIRKVFWQTSMALQSVHEKGLVHRDIKPENLLLDKNLDIKLCDFGWCCEADDLLASADRAGTLAYMSPEAHQDKPQRAAADIWALGILLYEMYHKQEPFPGATSAERFHSILTLKPVFDPKFPKEAASIFYSCTMVDPSQRQPISWILSHPFFKQFSVVNTSPTHCYTRADARPDFKSTKYAAGQSPYAAGMAASAGSIDFAGRNPYAHHASLLGQPRTDAQVKARPPAMLVVGAKDTSAERPRLNCDSVRDESLERRNGKPTPNYCPLTIIQKRVDVNENSLRRSLLTTSRADEKILMRGLWDSRGPGDEVELKKRNCSLETAAVSNVGFQIKRVTTNDLMNGHLNLYQNKSSSQAQNNGFSRPTYPSNNPYSNIDLADLPLQKVQSSTVYDLIQPSTKARQPIFQIPIQQACTNSDSKQVEGYNPNKNENLLKMGRVFSTGSTGEPVIISSRPRSDLQRFPPMPTSAGLARVIAVDANPAPFESPLASRSANFEAFPSHETGHTLRLVEHKSSHDGRNSFVSISSRDGSVQPKQRPASPKLVPKSKFANSSELTSAINRYSPVKQRPADSSYLGVDSNSNVTATGGLKYRRPQDDKTPRGEIILRLHSAQQPHTISAVRNISGQQVAPSHV